MATKQRKAKRSLPRVLPAVVTLMKTIKAQTKASANCEQVAAASGGTFENAQDLGAWIAGSVTRMNDPENIKNGTNLHKLAQTIFAKLQETSPESDFAVSGGNDAIYAAMSEDLDI